MKNDIELLKKYMEEPYSSFNKKSDYTKFSDAGPVWQWTNEPINAYYANDLEGKKVLSVGAGGDHILHAILAGSKDITAFDVNKFSKYYVDLKMAMIKQYDYDEFWKKATILTQDGIKNIGVLNEIIKTLPESHQEFFEIIQKKFYDNRNNARYLERMGMHLLSEFSYGNRRKYAYDKVENYNELKERIDGCNIKYTDYLIEELSFKLKNKYDIVYASEYMNQIKHYI